MKHTNTPIAAAVRAVNRYIILEELGVKRHLNSLLEVNIYQYKQEPNK